jgi:hypothetical protein
MYFAIFFYFNKIQNLKRNNFQGQVGASPPLQIYFHGQVGVSPAPETGFVGVGEARTHP